MSEIRLRVVGKELSIIKSATIISGEINETECVFEFDSSWDGTEKTAVFYVNETEQEYALIKDNKCQIPYRQITTPNVLYIGVFTVKSNKAWGTNFINTLVTNGASAVAFNMIVTQNLYMHFFNMIEQVKNSETNVKAAETVVKNIEQTLSGVKDAAITATTAANTAATNASNIANTYASQLAAKASKDEVNTAITNMGSASPKGTYVALTDLQNAFPTGSTGIYVVTSDGKWYYWNGSAWTAGGQYQSTGISDYAIDLNKTSQGVSDFISTGEYMPDNWEIGGINVSTGADDTRTTVMKTMGYIKLKAGTEIKLTSYANYYLVPVLYDLNKGVVGYYILYNGSYILQNDCYIRLASAKIGDTELTQTDLINIAKLIVITPTTVKLSQTIKDFLLNGEFYADDWEIGGIDVSTGLVNSKNYVMRTKQLFKLKAGSSVKLTDYSNYMINPIYYNLDMTYIQDSYKELRNTGDEFVIPYDCYVRLTSARNVEDQINYPLNDSDLAAITKIALINCFAKKHKGKKMNLLSDSIGWGYTPITGEQMARPFANVVKERLSLSVVRNYGISGSTISLGNYPMSVRYADMDNEADYVCVFGGTNDCANSDFIIHDDDGLPLGTINDNITSTFYGALNILCDGLITKYPSSKIFFITPLHREGGTETNGLGFYLVDYVNAIKKVCEKFGIPVLDLYNNAGLYPSNATQKALYAEDGLHPNQLFHETVLAPKICTFVENNFIG